jgi:hypothetical protein
MATSEDLSRWDEHLRPLASIVHAAAQAESAVGTGWVAVVLDARFSDRDGSILDKIRVERADGTFVSVSLPVDGTLQLIALGQARASGADRWYGLLVRVTAEGACEVKFNYDPACVEDGSFFAE